MHLSVQLATASLHMDFTEPDAVPEDVLNRLYCYCGCDKHQGHTSLLSCYTDGHAAT